MGVITNLSVTSDVALVTLNMAPCRSGFRQPALSGAYRAGCNCGYDFPDCADRATGALNFTAKGEDIGKIMEISARIREKYPTIKPLVSGNNVKIFSLW